MTIDTANGAATDQYYLTNAGKLSSLADALRANPAIARPQTAEEIAAWREVEARALQSQQMTSRPERIYGQVLVQGRVVATVFESGTALTEREIPGLSSGGAGPSLAQARLREIAKAVGGEVKRNAFLAAEEIYHQMGWDALSAQFKT